MNTSTYIDIYNTTNRLIGVQTRELDKSIRTIQFIPGNNAIPIDDYNIAVNHPVFQMNFKAQKAFDKGRVSTEVPLVRGKFNDDGAVASAVMAACQPAPITISAESSDDSPSPARRRGRPPKGI